MPKTKTVRLNEARSSQLRRMTLDEDAVQTLLAMKHSPNKGHLGLRQKIRKPKHYTPIGPRPQVANGRTKVPRNMAGLVAARGQGRSFSGIEQHRYHKYQAIEVIAQGLHRAHQQNYFTEVSIKPSVGSLYYKLSNSSSLHRLRYKGYGTHRYRKLDKINNARRGKEALAAYYQHKALNRWANFFASNFWDGDSGPIKQYRFGTMDEVYFGIAKFFKGKNADGDVVLKSAKDLEIANNGRIASKAVRKGNIIKFRNQVMTPEGPFGGERKHKLNVSLLNRYKRYQNFSDVDQSLSGLTLASKSRRTSAMKKYKSPYTSKKSLIFEEE